MSLPNATDNRDLILRELGEALVSGEWEIERFGNAFMVTPRIASCSTRRIGRVGGRNPGAEHGSTMNGEITMPSTRVLQAVYDEDLDGLLQSLGLRQDLDNGNLRCFCCGAVLKRETVGCLFPFEGSIHLCCEAPPCMARLPVQPTERKTE